MLRKKQSDQEKPMKYLAVFLFPQQNVKYFHSIESTTAISLVWLIEGSLRDGLIMFAEIWLSHKTTSPWQRDRSLCPWIEIKCKRLIVPWRIQQSHSVCYGNKWKKNVHCTFCCVCLPVASRLAFLFVSIKYGWWNSFETQSVSRWNHNTLWSCSALS